MPRGDRTGPGGRGSRTGRGLGYCTGYDRPGYAQPGPGRGGGRGGGFGGGRGRGFGWGRGRGFGRGRRFGRGPPPDVLYPYDDPYEYEREPYYDQKVVASRPEDEAEYLKRYLEDLEAELEDVKKRIKDLSSKK